MLVALSIRDFVIVERLELEFRTGFTVLTGETGAGKSILIDALQFVLGERAEADSVREGCARAEVGAEFDCGTPVADWLQAAGLDGAAGGGDAVLVRRTLDNTGRSRGFINGSAATLGQLRELGLLLLDVHGQHEHQLLLRPTAQQQLLDGHGQLHPLAAQVAQAHGAWRAAERALAAAQAAREEAQTQSESLRQQIDELDVLAPQEGEWERVEAEQRRLAHGAALIEGARAAIDVIAEGDECLQQGLARLGARLTALSAYDAALAPILAALASAGIQLEEAARELGQYAARYDLDEGQLARTEERLAAIHAAGRKWRCAPAQLPMLLAQTRARQQALLAAQDLGPLQAVQARTAAHYAQLAADLSAGRRAAAASLAREVTRAMQDLAMDGARFEVRLQAVVPGAGGLESVEFLVGGHEAGSARPLAKVASGGELSRIGLAISVIAASANLVPTLIFDEVDAGIGGQVAATVGRLLRELGRSRQVFCVTHLPQVAACGDQHYAVSKGRDARGQPRSDTQALAGNARVSEVARMLGGAQITELTQRHAREMLNGR